MLLFIFFIVIFLIVFNLKKGETELKCSGIYNDPGIFWSAWTFNCIQNVCSATENNVSSSRVNYSYSIQNGQTINIDNTSGAVANGLLLNCSGEKLYYSGTYDGSIEDGSFFPEGLSPGDTRTYVITNVEPIPPVIPP